MGRHCNLNMKLSGHCWNERPKIDFAKSDNIFKISLLLSFTAYGLGTLVTLLVSACSLFGLVVYRWRDTDAYQYLICTMLGLAVGALVGDAILHLGPGVS